AELPGESTGILTVTLFPLTFTVPTVDVAPRTSNSGGTLSVMVVGLLAVSLSLRTTIVHVTVSPTIALPGEPLLVTAGSLAVRPPGFCGGMTTRSYAPRSQAGPCGRVTPR